MMRTARVPGSAELSMMAQYAMLHSDGENEWGADSGDNSAAAFFAEVWHKTKAPNCVTWCDIELFNISSDTCDCDSSRTVEAVLQDSGAFAFECEGEGAPECASVTAEAPTEEKEKCASITAEAPSEDIEKTTSSWATIVGLASRETSCDEPSVSDSDAISCDDSNFSNDAETSSSTKCSSMHRTTFVPPRPKSEAGSAHKLEESKLALLLFAKKSGMPNPQSEFAFTRFSNVLTKCLNIYGRRNCEALWDWWLKIGIKIESMAGLTPTALPAPRPRGRAPRC